MALSTEDLMNRRHDGHVSIVAAFRGGGAEGVEQCEAVEWVTFISRRGAIRRHENRRRPPPGGTSVRRDKPARCRE